jgi:hypothetical protein
MTPERRKTIRLGNEFLASLADLRGTIRETETFLRRGLKAVEQGDDPPSLLASFSPAGPRQSLQEALETAEKARHAFRLQVFRQCLAAGMSIGELARAFGFSRQLASRYAREAKAGE